MALDRPTVAARIFATVTIRAMPILRLIGRSFCADRNPEFHRTEVTSLCIVKIRK